VLAALAEAARPRWPGPGGRYARPVASAKPLQLDPIAEARRHWEAQGWGEAAAGMAMVTSIMRAQQILIARVDRALAGFGLTFARYEVLMLLLFSRRGALPLGKVGARLQVHPASVTNAVNRLEADGLVRREAHPTDKRTTLAAVTPAGRRLGRRATRALNTAVFASTGMTEDQLEQVFRLLRSLRMAAGDF
jgi:DNA-binding MarR family transcriptional regulator